LLRGRPGGSAWRRRWMACARPPPTWNGASPAGLKRASPKLFAQRRTFLGCSGLQTDQCNLPCSRHEGAGAYCQRSGNRHAIVNFGLL